MTNKHSNPVAAPTIWDSSSGFPPAFLAAMAVFFVSIMVFKGHIG